jgi:hypothetical protein
MAPELGENQRYNWWQVLQDLSMHGMTMQAISDATGIPVSTLHGYKNLDAEPKHADGERLLAAWHRRMHPPVPRITGNIRQSRRVTK